MYRRSVLVFLRITLLLSSSRLYVETALCSPADGTHTKVFYLPENSDNGTSIGRLDLAGNAEVGSGQTISLSVDASYLSLPNQCGANGKKCNSWLSLEPSSQDLTLFLNEGEILDRDGPLGVKRIDAKIVCIETTGPNTGSNTDIYVVIFVEDVNDNDPIFVNDDVSVSVNELTPQNTKIVTLTVTDQDKISNRTFRIASSTKPEYFTITDSSVGDIILVENLDYESLKVDSTVISLAVEVEDTGIDETRTAVAAVTIRVIDGDDQSPMFQPCVPIVDSCHAVIYHARLSRSAEPGTELSFISPGPILAVDPDVDLSEPTEIVYSVHSNPSSIVDAIAYFNIDHTTGIVVLQNILSTSLPSEGFSLYIKATQANDQSKSAFAKLIVTMVDILEDLHPSQIQNENFKGFVHPQEGDVVFVRNADGSLFHLVATDEDYVNSSFVPPLDFEIVNHMPLFQVTNDGFVVYKRYKADLSTLPSTIQIRALNTEATSEQTRRSKIVSITVEESTSGEACCGGNSTEGLIGGIAATAALLCAALIAIILLAWVVVKYRRKSLRRKSLEGFQNHYANKLTPNYDSLSNNINNNNNMNYNQETVHRNQLSTISNCTVTSLSQPRHKGHRTQNNGKSSRYFANGKNTSPGLNEDSPSIAPYESFSAIDAVRSNAAANWENFDVKLTINYHQLSVEQETLHSSQKRGQRGFLTLQNGHITKCFVKTYSESYPHKRHLASDFSAMNEILNVRSCTQINLMKFLGCSLHQGSLYAVSEFVASQTDLRTALRNSRMRDHTSVISSFSGSQLSNLALAIADGLRYLHGHSVAHGNICSSQILLTEQMVPKLKGCCGKSSFRLRKHKTLRWAAPEVVTDHEYLIASDLWSYAIVVWEIATLGGLPYPRVTEKGIKHHLESLRHGEYPMPNCRNIVRRLWTILQSCWELNPNDRPTIADVYKKSSKLREATTSIFVAVWPGYEFAPTTVLQKK